MKRPLVSIVSVYYNRQKYAHKSVQSLLEQTYPNLEIILVDDGSTDGTLETLQSFSDPRLRLITGANQGFVSALKNAITTARGSLIAIQGSGDLSRPKRIEKQVAFLENNKEVGVVGCYVHNVNLATMTAGRYASVIGENLSEQLKAKCPFTHGEVMFRKDLYDQVGGYRTFFKYAQDYDLWFRLSTVTTFGIVPEVLYTRFAHESGVQLNLEKKAEQLRYADFAVQCFESRDERGHDLVDRYGADALTHRQKSKRLAAELWPKAMDALEQGNTDVAARLNALSLLERLKTR
jgi:glycosyltransferase involved in cell wall biosynthesis